MASGGRDNKPIKVISFVILFFFTWTSGGLFQVAYAVNSAVEQKGSSAEVKNQAKKEKPEEKFQKALEEIEGVIEEVQQSRSAEVWQFSSF